MLLPQPLALPTGFLRRITNIKGRKKKSNTPLTALKTVKILPSSCRFSGEGGAGSMVQCLQACPPLEAKGHRKWEPRVFPKHKKMDTK